MTDQEMRIAIAEACQDWTYHHGGLYCAITNCENRTLAGRLFDPLEDLNAMNEAVMGQPQDMRVRINHALMESLNPKTPYLMDRVVNATARQRAEAFVRTIGKWRNG